MPSRKSPQEKKLLSYAKDRRNDYGESDKASRKTIPLRKRLVNRANRHRDAQSLMAAVGPVDLESAAAAEISLLSKRRKRWRKSADSPLGITLEWTVRFSDDTPRVKAALERLQRVRRRLTPRWRMKIWH